MGNPTLDSYVTALLDWSGKFVASYVRERVPSTERILDVGAGWGKYRFLLPEYEMDAVEIWRPYVELHRLDQYYRAVFEVDVREWQVPERYGAVIMGDVLEHLSADDGVTVVKRIIEQGATDLIVAAVPFEMTQGVEEGNPYEVHEQYDLTTEVMAERYPWLHEVAFLPANPPESEHAKAVYVSR